MNAAPFDFESLATALLANARDLLAQWFPAGRFVGHEFLVGDLAGSPGESLSINVRTGKWADFNAGDRGGDLISLFAASHHLSQIDAAKQLANGHGFSGPVSVPKPAPQEWAAILPIPEDAPFPPEVHPTFGHPAHVARYRDCEGRLLGLIYRCELPGERKQVVPLTFCRREDGRTDWRWQSLPKPRSLYHAELLQEYPDARVLVVEGEPKCDDVNALIQPGFIAVAWPNGASSWNRANWQLLEGRDVTIWPDNDDPGIKAAQGIKGRFPTCRVLAPPADKPKGWDVGDAIKEGWDRDRILAFVAPPPPPLPSEDDYGADIPFKKSLWSSTASWVESEIPTRPWVVPGYLLRGSVTLLSGAGAAGKSMIAKAWAVSAICAIPWGRFAPPRPLRALSYNVEDDRDEEHRRLSATLRQFDRIPKDLDGNLMLVGPNDIGTLIERDAASGRLRLTDAMNDLIALIEEFKPDIIFLDPLVELHTVEENDNTGLRAIVAQLRTLARTYNAAVVILHHTRKGATTPGDPDASRGAGSIVGAARVTLTVCTMSEDEAKDFGMPISERKKFFRVDDAKVNYRALGEPEWFERVPYSLDNLETTAAAVPWTPPSHTTTTTELDGIVAAIAAAPVPFSPRLSADRRSFATLCQRFGITRRDEQRNTLAAIKSSLGVVEAPFTRPGKSKGDVAIGLRTADGQPSSITWED